jgi:hypothetical protein
MQAKTAGSNPHSVARRVAKRCFAGVVDAASQARALGRPHAGRPSRAPRRIVGAAERWVVLRDREAARNGARSLARPDATGLSVDKLSLLRGEPTLTLSTDWRSTKVRALDFFVMSVGSMGRSMGRSR